MLLVAARDGRPPVSPSDQTTGVPLATAPDRLLAPHGLLGFERVELQPGESRQVTLTAEPRLLATFDGTAGQWRIAEGTHRIALARSADEPVLTAETTLTGRLFGT